MTATGHAGSELRHASAVALHGRAALICGPSGAGKSALALQMMALGAGLIADDQVELFLQAGQVHVCAPATLPALIEARGIGLLPAALHPAAPVFVIVDLALTPQGRLPPPLRCGILTTSLPLFAGAVGPHLAASLIQILTTGHIPHHA